MEEYEVLKKLFMEKEKENLRLRQEIENIAVAEDSSPDINNEEVDETINYKNQILNKSHNDYENQRKNKLCLNNSAIGGNEKNKSFFADKEDAFVSNKTAKYMDLGRAYVEKEKRLNRTNIVEGTNNNSIKVLETQINDLKNKINLYEKDVPKNSDRHYSQETPNLEEKLMKSDLMIEDLQLKLKLKEEEKSQLKEMYEKELSIKAEIYNNNITHLNKTHQEEIKKLRIDYENKMDELVKKNEEEKFQLSSKLASIENEMIGLQSKSILQDKSDIVDFQRKYLNEMRDLQSNFEEFKIKTYDQLKSMKHQKEEAIAKSKFYKESFLKLKSDFDRCISQFQDNENKMKGKIESFKNILQVNEELKQQCEEAKKESSYLKLQVNKLQVSEKRLHNLLIEKDKSNISGYVDYLTNGTANEILFTNQNNKSYGNLIQTDIGQNVDLGFSNIFSPIKKEPSLTSFVKNSNNIHIEDHSASHKPFEREALSNSRIKENKQSHYGLQRSENIHYDQASTQREIRNKTPVGLNKQRVQDDYSDQNEVVSDGKAIYKKKVMERKNLSTHINPGYDDVDTNINKKLRDLTPTIKPKLYNKNISVSPYRIDDKHNMNTSINNIMTNRTNCPNLKKKFLVGKIDTGDGNDILSSDEEYDNNFRKQIR